MEFLFSPWKASPAVIFFFLLSALPAFSFAWHISIMLEAPVLLTALPPGQFANQFDVLASYRNTNTATQNPGFRLSTPCSTDLAPPYRAVLNIHNRKIHSKIPSPSHYYKTDRQRDAIKKSDTSKRIGRCSVINSSSEINS